MWDIANLLRGKMDADDYRNYILGFIFYKYLSEKLHLYADEALKTDNITYTQIKENTDDAIALFSDKEAKQMIVIEPYEEQVKKFNDT